MVLSIRSCAIFSLGFPTERRGTAPVFHSRITTRPVKAESLPLSMEELELEPEKARAFTGNDAELLRNTLYQDQYIYMAE